MKMATVPISVMDSEENFESACLDVRWSSSDVEQSHRLAVQHRNSEIVLERSSHCSHPNCPFEGTSSWLGACLGGDSFAAFVEDANVAIVVGVAGGVVELD